MSVPPLSSEFTRASQPNEKFFVLFLGCLVLFFIFPLVVANPNCASVCLLAIDTICPSWNWTNRTKGKRKGNWRAPIDNTTVSGENAEQFLDWPSTIREFTFTWRRTADFVCHLISRQLFVLVFVWFKRSGRQEKRGGYVGGVKDFNQLLMRWQWGDQSSRVHSEWIRRKSHLWLRADPIATKHLFFCTTK